MLSQSTQDLASAILEFFGAMGELIVALALLLAAVLGVVAMVAVPILAVWAIWRLAHGQTINPLPWVRARRARKSGT